MLMFMDFSVLMSLKYISSNKNNLFDLRNFHIFTFIICRRAVTDVNSLKSLRELAKVSSRLAPK